MGTRTRYKKSEVSREQVLQAAIDTLAAKGYAHTSVGDIAERAGMSKGSVLYHFESKDDLITHVLHACIVRIGAPVRAAWERPGVSSTERIAGAIARSDQAIARSRALFPACQDGQRSLALRFGGRAHAP